MLAVNLLPQARVERKTLQRADVQSCVSRASRTVMIAEIIAVDGIAISLNAVVQSDVSRQDVTAAQGRLVSFHRVPVGENGGLIPIKNEQVRVAAVRKRGLSLLTQALA